MQFEPMLMAQDLATSVELLSADFEPIPSARLDQSDAERLVASLSRIPRGLATDHTTSQTHDLTSQDLTPILR
jgi:hypothetical protein